MESLDQFRRLEERKKARNVFVMSLCLSDHQVLQNIACLSSFFSISLGCARFFRSYFVLSKLLEFKEFNNTIIPIALVGYETGYSQRGAMRLVAYLPSHIRRALME